MKIEVLGTGCSSCVALFNNVKTVLAHEKIFAQVEKIDNIVEIMKYNVISTPALVINGKVKSAGEILNIKRIEELIKEG